MASSEYVSGRPFLAVRWVEYQLFVTSLLNQKVMLLRFARDRLYSGRLLVRYFSFFLEETSFETKGSSISSSFKPIFASFVGGNINIRILPPTKEAKIGQNNPKKRRTLSFERGLIYFCRYCPRKWNRKLAQKNPKIDRILTSKSVQFSQLF
jgi:hypothetical protein